MNVTTTISHNMGDRYRIFQKFDECNQDFYTEIVFTHRVPKPFGENGNENHQEVIDAKHHKTRKGGENWAIKAISRMMFSDFVG